MTMVQMELHVMITVYAIVKPMSSMTSVMPAMIVSSTSQHVKVNLYLICYESSKYLVKLLLHSEIRRSYTGNFSFFQISNNNTILCTGLELS